MLRITRLGVCVVLLTVIDAGAALADGGVTIDPGSPAGKEYALPVEKARRDAADGGKTGKVDPGAQTAPLFGAGVTSDASSASSTKKHKKKSRAGSALQRAAKPSTGGRKAQKPKHTAAVAATGDSSSSGALALFAGGGGVALLAGLGGLAVRRRRPPGDR